jgi:hypothetical protein
MLHGCATQDIAYAGSAHGNENISEKVPLTELGTFHNALNLKPRSTHEEPSARCTEQLA